MPAACSMPAASPVPHSLPLSHPAKHAKHAHRIHRPSKRSRRPPTVSLRGATPRRQQPMAMAVSPAPLRWWGSFRAYVVPLTVTKKSLASPDGDFAITDANGAVVLKVKGAIFKIEPRPSSTAPGCPSSPCKKRRPGKLALVVAGHGHDYGAWSEKKNHWLMFYLVDGLTVTGNSTRLLDGIGQTWWVDKCKADNDVRKPNSTLKDFFSLIPPCIWQVPFDLPIFFREKLFNDCVIKAPTALVVMNCTDVELSQFSSKDSPQIHIGLSMSGKVNVTQLTITAPENSPNTNGVHVDRSEDVDITGSTIGTGDYCISIGPGSRFVTVDGIVCGPGHGVR
ncbi:hypothetical protein ZWY2020_045532 [Hordeum vulgare]|nr:hypothetical protein ZWY2020_045532 [Hordeum vulgare]